MAHLFFFPFIFVSMNKTITIISIIFFAFSLSACGDKDDKTFVPSINTGVFKYTDQNATDAFKAFNTYLLEPERNLYLRDTRDLDRLGAIWTQAIYWDITMNAYKRTQNSDYLKLIETIYQGGLKEYDNYNWDNGGVWFIYDDIMWWAISMGRAYELTKDEKYLALAKSSFKRVWSGSTVVGDPGSYDPIKGGMFWNWDHNNPASQSQGMGKMSCINYPTVIGAMTLYNITKDVDYLNKAKSIYNWAHANLFDTKLGRVADSKHGAGTPDWSLHTYNQATCIGAAVMLYKATNEKHFLDDAILTANYTMNTMSDINGILPYEGDGTDINNEQGVYNAILAQYMIRLIEDGNQPQYLTWLRKNINTGWKNRDSVRNLTTKNYKKATTKDQVISVYDACSIVALMQVCPADTTK